MPSAATAPGGRSAAGLYLIPPSPGWRGLPGGALPTERFCPFTGFLTIPPPFAPAGDFFPLESHGRGGQGKGETL